MRFRRIMFLVLLLLAACGEDTPEATPTLAGAVVPTRTTPTETATVTPSVTPSPTPTLDLTATEQILAETSTAEAATQAADETATANAPTATLTPTVTLTPTATPTTEPVVPSPTPAQDPNATGPDSISYGDVVFDNLNDDTYERIYTFEGSEGDRVTITLTRVEGLLDPLLILRGPNGDQLVRNDDDPVNSTLDSAIRDYALPQSGVYTIVASRFGGLSGTSSGGFRLSLDAEGVSQPDPPDRDLLDYGDRVEGEINDQNPEVLYRFEAADGDVIDIRMNTISGGLDPVIILRSPSGDDIARNDDAASGGFNSHLEGFTIPADGVYTIVATRFGGPQGTSSGRFAVILTRSGEQAAAGPQELELGVPTVGEITLDGGFQVFTFEGSAGQTISVTMDQLSGDLDPYLMIVGPNGRPMAYNDDRSDMDRNATLDHIPLRADGTYEIVATRFRQLAGNTQGRFEVVVEETSGTTFIAQQIQEISYGDQVSGDLAFLEEDLYAFQGRAGAQITINMELPSGSTLDPQLILYTGRGVELMRNNDDLLDNDETFDDASVRDVILPYPGWYLIGANGFDSSEGRYELDLSLDARPVAGTPPPFYLPLMANYSAGFPEGYTPIVLYGVGDWTLDDANMEIQSLLTYRLNQVPPGREVAGAVLDLSACVSLGVVLDGDFGPIKVGLNGTYTTLDEISIDLDPDAPTVANVAECEPVDVTSAVRRAYQEGDLYIQFVLSFPQMSVIANDEFDAVIFNMPTLQLQFDGPP